MHCGGGQGEVVGEEALGPGEKVEVALQQANQAQPGTMTGTLIGVEAQTHQVGKDATVQVEVLNLWCADGIRSCKLSEVQRLRMDDTPPPPPPALTVRAWVARLVGAGVLVAVVATLPFSMRWAGPAFAVDYGLIVAMAVLAVSVLGWIGEISLAPVAQMGFGVVAVNVCQVHNVPFGFTLPIVAVASIPISLVLATFTLRLKGVSFAIATR